jgi:hypothetical protein
MERPRSPPSSKMGRGAKRRKNEQQHLDGELVRARRSRKRAMKAWMETTSEEERARLANRLLAAMDREDQATVPRRWRTVQVVGGQAPR